VLIKICSQLAIVALSEAVAGLALTLGQRRSPFSRTWGALKKSKDMGLSLKLFL
jgi:hypothetical protein